MAKKPEKPVCSINGCQRQSSSRGWCKAHHKRWLRHGDPVAGRIEDGAPSKFISEALTSQTNDCILWPFSLASGGYGSYFRNGKSCHAHAATCEQAHGKKPSADHEVAHGCGNRRCINPRHLRWATRKENHADKILHGTAQRGERHPNAKLTVKQVTQIRAVHNRTLASIADQFGVTRSTVWQIRSGRVWRHVS